MRGVQVRLLLDGHLHDGNAETLHDLHGVPAVSCRVVRHRPGVEAHWKLLLAGRGGLAVGSGNLIQRDAPRHRDPANPPGDRRLGHAGNREWWALARGVPGLVQASRTRFTTAWRSAAAPLAPVVPAEEMPAPAGLPDPLVPPLRLDIASRDLACFHSGAALRGVLETMLESAEKRAYVTVPYCHTASPRVHDLLRQLADLDAADTRLLLGNPPSPGDAALLRGLGPPVRVMNRLRCTTGHAKGAVVDTIALVMSSNFSDSGLGGNYEAGLRIASRAAANYFADAFARDWEVADPLDDGFAAE
jgi:hypothetical protein